MTGRHYSTGSVTDGDGNVRAYLHIKRLRELSESIEVHCRHVPMLQAAADAMAELAKRNQRMGRELGAVMRKRVATAKGWSFPPDDPSTPEKIAELANEHPVLVYVGRDPRRVRATAASSIPRGARMVARFDENTDYRLIVQAIASIPRPEST